MTTANAEGAGDKKQARRNRIFKGGMWVVGTIIVLLIAYGSGMRSQTWKLKAAAETRISAERDARLARLEVTARDATIQQLEARRQLHLTLLELDRRNFGTAQGHLTAAASRLESAQALGSATSADFSALVPRLREMNLTTTAADFAAQREQMLALVQEMDRALVVTGPQQEAQKSAIPPPPAAPIPNRVVTP